MIHLHWFMNLSNQHICRQNKPYKNNISIKNSNIYTLVMSNTTYLPVTPHGTSHLTKFMVNLDHTKTYSIVKMCAYVSLQPHRTHRLHLQRGCPKL